MVDVQQHLLTKYVFFDTEALRSLQFDWSSVKLLKIKEFAAADQVRILITDVTKDEIRHQLREQLTNASTAMEKHRVVLGQLGVPSFRSTITDEMAIARLYAAFEKFLSDVKAIDVPLVADVKVLVSKYFSRLPPFSEKKKSEFPDAIVIESLTAWCASKKSTAYVVSADPDMKACCSGELLHHAETVGEIVSQATVSKEHLDALERGIRKSGRLLDELRQQVRGLRVVASRMTQSSLGASVADGRVLEVIGTDVLHVNVVNREGDKFECEIEFEAEIEIEASVEVERGFDNDGYPERDFSIINTTITTYLVAGLDVVGPPTKPDEWSFESVYVQNDEVELDRSDLKSILRETFRMRW